MFNSSIFLPFFGHYQKYGCFKRKLLLLSVKQLIKVETPATDRCIAITTRCRKTCSPFEVFNAKIITSAHFNAT